MYRIIALLVFAALAAAGRPTLAAESSRESGTVVSVDRTAQTITLEEMGPWHGPTTATTERSIRFTRSTRIELASRAKRPADRGWPGGYVETSLSAADVHAGDFATVELAREDGRAVAIAIDVVRPTSSPAVSVSPR